MIQDDKLRELTSYYKNEYQPNTERAWSRMQQRMDAERNGAKVVSMPRKKFSVLSIAVAVVALIVAGVVMSELFNQDPFVQTAINEVKTINLADGSVVYLNENTTLSYPETFSDKDNRTVTLNGEAFFEIEKNPEKPFFVKMNDGKVRVLGTSFHIRSIDSEDFVEVEVTSGQVEFLANGHQGMKMSKETKCILNKTDYSMKIAPAIGLNGSAWMRKELQFIDTPLEEVFSMMERFYKIDINISNPTLLECGGFTSNFKKDKLKEAFEILNTVYQVKIKEKGSGEYELVGGICS